MTRSSTPDAGSRRDWPSIALAAAVGAVGLLMMHHPMILSGLRLVQVDLADTRLINYLLEHNYLWYRGAPGHERFWDPPFFYPARNIAAYSVWRSGHGSHTTWPRPGSLVPGSCSGP